MRAYGYSFQKVVLGLSALLPGSRPTTAAACGSLPRTLHACVSHLARVCIV